MCSVSLYQHVRCESPHSLSPPFKLYVGLDAAVELVDYTEPKIAYTLISVAPIARPPFNISLSLSPSLGIFYDIEISY